MSHGGWGRAALRMRLATRSRAPLVRSGRPRAGAGGCAQPRVGIRRGTSFALARVLQLQLGEWSAMVSYTDHCDSLRSLDSLPTLAKERAVEFGYRGR